MPIRFAFWAVVISLLGSAPAIAQQPREPIEITSVRVGWPASPQGRNDPFSTGPYVKDGCWTPIYVDLTCHKAYPGQAVLVFQSNDCDEVATRFVVPIPQLQPKNTEMVIGYTRPGGHNGQVDVSIQIQDKNLNEPKSFPHATLDPAKMLYLAVGSKLDGSRIPGIPFSEDEAAQTNYGNSRSALAAVTTVNQLPTQWFAYEGVDAVILSTIDREFTKDLVEERAGRKAALVEWVRRGGRLVIALGRNADMLADAGELKGLLPVLPTGTMELELPRLAWRDSSSDTQLGKATVARLERRPDRQFSTLVAGPKGENGQPIPLVIRSAYGLGRVTIVAFDLDEKPLATWKSRDQFWRELSNAAGPRVPTEIINSNPGYANLRGYRDNAEDSLFTTDMIQQLENFPGVPVISFGWVALFILIYIIIVGPLDYLFLKKVVKRLELTWITFPLIVLVVSATAYYTAYALKGSDLRINKYDLVDIDVSSNTVQGRTWFTLFSPRIQNYRIGVEPGSPDWAPNSTEPPDVLVGWAGQNRQTRQSLFPRPYRYVGNATGLDGVPVQVWSTKGFQSQWLANLSANKPLAVSNLRHPPGLPGLIGTLTVNLPVPLENCFLIVPSGESDPLVLDLGSLVPGTPKSVTAQEPRRFSNWIGAIAQGSLQNAEGKRVAISPFMPVKMLFHEKSIGSQEAPQNASLRSLDQSWRLNADNLDEAILIGTLPRREGESEDLTADSASPSRLWLGAFPDSGKPRPKIDGKMRQDACVRIFLPIKPQ